MCWIEIKKLQNSFISNAKLFFSSNFMFWKLFLYREAAELSAVELSQGGNVHKGNELSIGELSFIEFLGHIFSCFIKTPTIYRCGLYIKMFFRFIYMYLKSFFHFFSQVMMFRCKCYSHFSG